MTRIVVLGGFDWANAMPEADDGFDRQIVQLAERPRPQVVFLPTANSDDPRRIAAFEARYEQLACRVTTLRLTSAEPPPRDPAEMLLAADVIYADDGNARAMLARWRKGGIDRLLGEAGRRGALLVGNGEGAAGWFDYAFSDAQRWEQPDAWSFGRLRGMGFVPAVGCPHFRCQRRAAALANLVASTGQLALAIDDGAALAILGSRCQIWGNHRLAGVYRMFLEGADVVTERVVGDEAALEPALLFARGRLSPFERLPRVFVAPRLVPEASAGAVPPARAAAALARRQ